MEPAVVGFFAGNCVKKQHIPSVNPEETCCFFRISSQELPQTNAIQIAQDKFVDDFATVPSFHSLLYRKKFRLICPGRDHPGQCCPICRFFLLLCQLQPHGKSFGHDLLQMPVPAQPVSRSDHRLFFSGDPLFHFQVHLIQFIGHSLQDASCQGAGRKIFRSDISNASLKLRAVSRPGKTGIYV